MFYLGLVGGTLFYAAITLIAIFLALRWTCQRPSGRRVGVLACLLGYWFLTFGVAMLLGMYFYQERTLQRNAAQIRQNQAIILRHLQALNLRQDQTLTAEYLADWSTGVPYNLDLTSRRLFDEFCYKWQKKLAE